MLAAEEKAGPILRRMKQIRNDHVVWIGFAIICVLVVLLKEMMVVVLLLPIALASVLPGAGVVAASHR